MIKKVLPLLMVLAVTLSLVAKALAADKVRLGFLRPVVALYLPILAAEERNIWTENGLEIQAISFGTGPLTLQAAAARALEGGLTSFAEGVLGASKGVPVLMVGQLRRVTPYAIWVKAASPIKEAKELKGARIGIHKFQGPGHIMARTVLSPMGLDKEVKYVASGGIPQEMAAFRAGVSDGIVVSIQIMVKEKVAGRAREVLVLSDHLPPGFTGDAIFGTKDFAARKPEVLRRVVRALVQASNFILDNEDWAIGTIRREYGFSPEEAKLVHARLIKDNFSRDGGIPAGLVRSVLDVLVKWSLVKKEAAPSPEELFSTLFTG